MTITLPNNKPLGCYQCGATRGLMVEEKIDNATGKIIEKNFICLPCSGATFNEPV